MNDDWERSPLGWALFVLVLATFPIGWPVSEVIRSHRLGHFRALWDRRVRNHDQALAELRAGRPVSARFLLHGYPSMASGWDEEHLFAVRLQGGSEVVMEPTPGGEVQAFLRASGITWTTSRVRELGLVGPIGWVAWLVSALFVAWLFR